jgi:hypothetical protein
LYTGIYFENNNIISSFTFKLDNFFDSYYSIGYKNEDFWLSLQIGAGKKLLLNYKNMYLNLYPMFDKIYIRSDNYILKYDDENQDLYVDSIYFEKNEDVFYFRIPFKQNLFFVYSTYGPGIAFRIKI